MLEDGIFVEGDWIADEANQDIAKRFLKASFRGWIYCRDNPDDVPPDRARQRADAR